jgi:hypothetical protein
MSYHGVVYVDMQPLLYPGATQIKGAYKINPFVENEFQDKVNEYNLKNNNSSKKLYFYFYLDKKKKRNS